MSDVFAFQPPFRVEHVDASRQRTSSSVSTEAPVVTPPTGLPLSELASFNGYRLSRDRLPASSLNTTSSAPTFAFQPTPPSSSNLHASIPHTGTSSVDQPFAYRAPSTSLRDIATGAPLASPRQPQFTRESDPAHRNTRDEPMSQIQEGKISSLPHISSSFSFSGTSSTLSEKPKVDKPERRDEDVEIGRDQPQKLELDLKLSLTSTPNATLHVEPHLSDAEDSPYPEVRASVSNSDDAEMPCLTFRVWVIGILVCASGSAANIFFNFRNPAPWLSPLLILLFAHPCGLALGWLLPLRYWSLPQNLPFVGGWEFSLNPSPWTIKEHAMIVIMSYPATNPDYGLNIISVMGKLYGLKVSLGFTLLFLLSTQLIGIGLASANVQKP